METNPVVLDLGIIDFNVPINKLDDLITNYNLNKSDICASYFYNLLKMSSPLMLVVGQQWSDQSDYGMELYKLFKGDIVSKEFFDNVSIINKPERVEEYLNYTIDKVTIPQGWWYSYDKENNKLLCCQGNICHYYNLLTENRDIPLDRYPVEFYNNILSSNRYGNKSTLLYEQVTDTNYTIYVGDNPRNISWSEIYPYMLSGQTPDMFWEKAHDHASCKIIYEPNQGSTTMLIKMFQDTKYYIHRSYATETIYFYYNITKKIQEYHISVTDQSGAEVYIDNNGKIQGTMNEDIRKQLLVIYDKDKSILSSFKLKPELTVNPFSNFSFGSSSSRK
jgi:hypothetical protein